MPDLTIQWDIHLDKALFIGCIFSAMFLFAHQVLLLLQLYRTSGCQIFTLFIYINDFLIAFWHAGSDFFFGVWWFRRREAFSQPLLFSPPWYAQTMIHFRFLHPGYSNCVLLSPLSISDTSFLVGFLTRPFCTENGDRVAGVLEGVLRLY